MTDLRLSQLSVEILVRLPLLNLGTVTIPCSATVTSTLLGGTPVSPTGACKVGVFCSSADVRVFCSSGDGALGYVENTGSWASFVSMNFTEARGTSFYHAGIAPTAYNTVYVYADLVNVSGCTLYRAEYTGGAWVWDTGPHIFTGKGAASQNTGTFIDAVAMDGVDYIVVADHDDGRTILVKYANGVWSDPVPVLPMDIVSDPTDTTIPSSQFKPYSLTTENSQLVLVGRLVRPGSGSFHSDMLVMMRGDGEHWTLDRHHVIKEHEEDDYVGAKLYLEGDYGYLVSPQKVLRSTASNLLGTDVSSKKITVDNVNRLTYTHGGAGQAATLSFALPNADGTYDSDIGTVYSKNIAPNAEVTLELGWFTGALAGTGDYTQMNQFGVDGIEQGLSVDADSLSLILRSKSMKKLLDWRAAQAYDYFSQAKIWEDFSELGGYTEWNSGWELDEDAETLTSTKFFGYTEEAGGRVPLLAVDTTDWTTLDGVLVKVKFKFVSSAATCYYAAGIVLNATDNDYWEEVEAGTWSGGLITLWHVRDGVISDVYETDTGMSWSEDTWYDLAVLYRAATYQVFYKASASVAWTEASSDFPFLWDKLYPATEAEVYETDPEETQAVIAVGETYSADDGYVGLRAWCGVPSTVLNQDLWEPEVASQEGYEYIVVESVSDFPSSGVIIIDDERIIYTGVNTAQLTTNLSSNQRTTDQGIDVDSVTGWPMHGVIYLGPSTETDPTDYTGAYEAILYKNHYSGANPEFAVEGRGFGDTTPADFEDNDPVALDAGVARNCTHFFKAPYIRGVVPSEGSVAFIEDASEPWGAVDITDYRLELHHGPPTVHSRGYVTPADSGTATGGSTTSLNDDPKDWKPDREWRAWDHGGDDDYNWFELLMTDGGANDGHDRNIEGNDQDTVETEDSTPFPVAIGSGDTYEIWPRLQSKAVYDNTKTLEWGGGAEDHTGRTFVVISGTGAGQSRLIEATREARQAKPPHILLSSALDTKLDTTSQYLITDGEWGATEYRRISAAVAHKIIVKEPFDQAPSIGATYVIRGRGAYGTTPTAHADDASVHWYIDGPILFDNLEVYSLGRDYTVDWLFKDICYRAGAIDFTDNYLLSYTSSGDSVSADSYLDKTFTLPWTTRKNFEITVNMTLPDDDEAGWGLVYRAPSTSAGESALPRGSLAAYEFVVYQNSGNPFVALCDLDGGITELERHYTDIDIIGAHVWRVSVWDDFCSVWCDDRFVWAFHDTTYSDTGRIAIRLVNESAGALVFTSAVSVPEVTEREPWFGYVSGTSGQQALQELIRNRKVWYQERWDSSMELTRSYVRTRLEDYGYTYDNDNMHQAYRSFSDLDIASVVLVTSEEYAHYVDEFSLVKYGYRFREVSNPDLDSEEECYDDARMINRMGGEESEQRGFFSERAHLEIEPADYLKYDGTNYVVSDITIEMGQAQLSQRLGTRLYYGPPH